MGAAANAKARRVKSRPGTRCLPTRPSSGSGRRAQKASTPPRPRPGCRTYGPNRLPEGKKRGPFMRFLAQFNNILVYVLLAAGFTKLMLSLWVDAAIIFAVVVLNGLLGFIQEGRAEKALDSIRNMLSAEARTVRGGETRMLPAEQLVPGDVVLLESGDKIPADLRLVEAKNLRTEEAALTGESVPAEKTTDAGRRQRDRRRPRVHGVLRHDGRLRPRDRRRRRDGQRDGARPHQPAARRRQPARNAASAPDQEIRLCDHRGHRRDQRADLLLWPLARAHELRRALPGGRRHRGVADPGRTAGADHDHARHRRAAHGAAQRHHPAAAGGRDAGLGVAHLLGQDRHADADGDDGDLRRHRRDRLTRSPATAMRRRARSRQDGKPAGDAPVLALMGRVSMLCNDAELFQEDGAWRVEGDPTEGALYPFATKLGLDRQAEQAAAPAHRRDPVRVGAQVHGDAAQVRGRQRDAARQGRAGGDPRALRPPADGRRPAGAARPRAFHAGIGQARRAGRAGAGARVARESGREGRQSRSGRPAEDASFCSAWSACSTRRARRRSRR